MELKMNRDKLYTIIKLQCDNRISFSHAKMLLMELLLTDCESVEQLAESNGWLKSKNSMTEENTINKIIDSVLAQNANIVENMNKPRGRKKKAASPDGPIM